MTQHSWYVNGEVEKFTSPAIIDLDSAEWRSLL